MTDQEIQQHYLNTGCSVKELAQQCGIGFWKADALIDEALKVVKNQQRLERILDLIEMADQENELN